MLSKLLGGVGSLVVSLFWRLGPGARLLPKIVRRVLANSAWLSGLVDVVLWASQFANLSNEERRKHSLEAAGVFLRQRGVDLADHELALLVELVYGYAKRKLPQRIVRPPVKWTKVTNS
jgi:hypothetical protein